jgi:hypothetical protein
MIKLELNDSVPNSARNVPQLCAPIVQEYTKSFGMATKNTQISRFNSEKPLQPAESHFSV